MKTASEIAKEMLTPKERCGVAMSRLTKLMYGDETTNWRGTLSDEMDEDASKEIEGICEILMNATKPTAKSMTEIELERHAESELRATAEMAKAGKREDARKRLAHLRTQLSKARTAFDAGHEKASVEMFSGVDRLASLAKEAETLEAAVAPTEPTPAATPPAPAPAPPAVTDTVTETQPAAADASKKDEAKKDDVVAKALNDDWPDDLASVEEVKKARATKLTDAFAD